MTLVAATLWMSPATAFDLNIRSAVRSAYMCDTGDGKRAAMLAGHPSCGRSKEDNAERWRVLSRAHCTLNSAVDSGRPEAIQQAAKELQSIIDRSKMYKNCHSTMRGQARDLGAGFDAAITTIVATQLGAPAK
jgi:hypothetical protein